MATNSVRVTLSFPPGVLSNIDFVSRALGVSRSAFVSALMADVLPPLLPYARIVSSELSEADARRYRGEFASELNSMVERLNKGMEGLQDDLFKD